MLLIGPLPWQSGRLRYAAVEALGGIEAQLKELSVRCCSPQPSSLLFPRNPAASAEHYLRYGAQILQEQPY